MERDVFALRLHSDQSFHEDGAVSMVAATPWDALLRQAPQPRRLPDVQPTDRPGTKLATLLALLAERDSATTLTLSVCADLTSRQVWGLLKAPRNFGQVRFDSGRWSLVREFAGRDVERAKALLLDLGWRVVPPNAEVTGLGRNRSNDER